MARNTSKCHGNIPAGLKCFPLWPVGSRALLAACLGAQSRLSSSSSSVPRPIHIRVDVVLGPRLLIRGDGIASRHPAPEIDIRAAPRTEWTPIRFGSLSADRAIGCRAAFQWIFDHARDVAVSDCRVKSRSFTMAREIRSKGPSDSVPWQPSGEFSRIRPDRFKEVARWVR